jgi:hypothetical protein
MLTFGFYSWLWGVVTVLAAIYYCRIYIQTAIKTVLAQSLSDWLQESGVMMIKEIELKLHMDETWSHRGLNTSWKITGPKVEAHIIEDWLAKRNLVMAPKGFDFSAGEKAP